MSIKSIEPIASLWLTLNVRLQYMKIKITAFLVLLTIVWSMGLLTSYKRTEMHAHDFYEWLSELAGTPEYMNERPLEFRQSLTFPISQTELLKKLDECDRPFKKHLLLPIQAENYDVISQNMSDEHLPHFYYTKSHTMYHGATCISGISINGSFFTSLLQTKDGYFGIVVKTKVFGL